MSQLTQRFRNGTEATWSFCSARLKPINFLVFGACWNATWQPPLWRCSLLPISENVPSFDVHRWECKTTWQHSSGMEAMLHTQPCIVINLAHLRFFEKHNWSPSQHKMIQMESPIHLEPNLGVPGCWSTTWKYAIQCSCFAYYIIQIYIKHCHWYLNWQSSKEWYQAASCSYLHHTIKSHPGRHPIAYQFWQRCAQNIDDSGRNPISMLLTSSSSQRSHFVQLLRSIPLQSRHVVIETKSSLSPAEAAFRGT